MADFSFEILAKEKNSRARAALIKTRNGVIETPYLIPVATEGSIRGLTPNHLRELGVQCILANTYHLHLRPGDELVKKVGGLHSFTKFSGPIVTDSGGFQAFSLGLGKEHGASKIGFFPGNKRINDKNKEKKLAVVTDQGVKFRSIYDGSSHFIGPKESMEIQANLGADIIMAFDECTSPFSDYEYTKMANERTHKWAIESLEHHDKNQALYGIIQGGYFEDLRKESTQYIKSLPFEGIAIGGSLGKNKEDMHKILDWITPQLDEERPRHMLGIGYINDIFECVERGIDSFDCVSLTREARNGRLYVHPESGGNLENKFSINIRNACYASDFSPIDKLCRCPTCKDYNRAELRHLNNVREKNLSYYSLATIHNLYFMLNLMKEIRENIKDGTFNDLKKRWLGN
ncbi:MAG: tRNA guanosine(34) transglycosylase Tgt [Nanoarchaeota archaeon]